MAIKDYGSYYYMYVADLPLPFGYGDFLSEELLREGTVYQAYGQDDTFPYFIHEIILSSSTLDFMTFHTQ